MGPRVCLLVRANDELQITRSMRFARRSFLMSAVYTKCALRKLRVILTSPS